MSPKSYNKDDLYRFFAVTFGAAPGVTYMGQLIEAADYGHGIPQIVNIFTRKKQFTDVYPESLTPTEFASRLINNVVGNSATEDDDIYVNNWGFGAKPLMYLNDLNGGFALLDQQKLPPSPIDYTGSVALFEDIDGDGIKDILYFPGLGFQSSSKTAQFRFYKGLRQLGVTDLKT